MIIGVIFAIVFPAIIFFIIFFSIRKEEFKEKKQEIIQQNIQNDNIQNEDYISSKPKDCVYDLKGVRGRSIKVYKDKVVISVDVSLGSLLTRNATDGEKTIYYKDVIGVQFKKSGMAIGYLQLETASTSMNNRHDNFFNENSFTFDTTVISNERMEEVANYVKKQVEAYKNMGTVQVNSFSAADEIKKYKELLDMGALTQEEFDIKKKELLK